MLRKLKPGREEGYGPHMLLDSQWDAFASAVRHCSAATGPAADASPFGEDHRVGLKAARANSFFRNHYGFGKAKTHGEPWRRIETDWMGAGGELAIRLENLTNNSSLVLAIELTDSGKVLLFTGDAQIGNWLSWHQVSWQVGGETISAEDLLSRVVLYKVGHHGSHNATLKEGGLEAMTSPELAAMVPVDEKFAREVVHWEHPYEPLMKRLRQQTRGRVLLSDRKLPRRKPSGITRQAWRAFRRTVSQQKLYVEYTVG